MADELQLQFTMSGEAGRTQEAWKADPPPAFEGFSLVDEAIQSLVFEARYTDAVAKTMNFMSLGFFGKVENQWKLSVRFDPDGHTRTRVTIIGKASEETRAKLSALAAENGGPTGLTFGL